MAIETVVGAAGADLIREYLRQNPGVQLSPLWQPIGRRAQLVNGSGVDLSFRPRGSDYAALGVVAHFGSTSTADHAGLVRVEMRGASRAGYILGDETQPCPLGALIVGGADPRPIAPARLLAQDEDYTVTAYADGLAGTAWVSLTFFGFYLRGGMR